MAMSTAVPYLFRALLLLLAAWSFNTCGVDASNVLEGLAPIVYKDIHDPTVSLKGYMALPSVLESAMDNSTEGMMEVIDDDVVGNALDGDLVPAVVILPDWNNINEYEMTRAKMVAEELGYVAFAADIYGADLHDVQDFNQKIELATKYRSNMTLFNSRIESAIETIKAQPFVGDVAIVGYCLGGTGVLGYSFANTIDAANSTTGSIVAAVSFHGGLMDFEVAGKMANPVLVLSGGEDDAGTDVEDLEKKLEEANATWQITRYSGIRHQFTVFGADAYNKWVDQRSWAEMTTFLQEAFGQISYGAMGPTQDQINVQTVNYTDSEGFELEGYLALPPNSETTQKVPAVLVLPNWDGTSGPFGYEAQRARMIADELGYVAMVGDIFGRGKAIVDDTAERFLLLALYRASPDLFVQRIQAGIDTLLEHPQVDASKIYVAGYCFGGTGSIDYAFSANSLQNVKAVVPIHGGLNPLQAIKTDNVKPYVLVLSGGIDDAHGNPTKLELHLDKANADWEVSRYSKAPHSFTVWDWDAYNPMADSRSWWSMMSLFESITAGEEYSMVSSSSTSSSSSSSSSPEAESTLNTEEEEEEFTDDYDYFDSSAQRRRYSCVALVIMATLLAEIMC